MNQPRVLILHATSTNRDVETTWAIEQAGGEPTILHVNELRERPAQLHDFQMFILPGGFSYGDALDGFGIPWEMRVASAHKVPPLFYHRRPAPAQRSTLPD